jgi:hypothetical protein
VTKKKCDVAISCSFPDKDVADEILDNLLPALPKGRIFNGAERIELSSENVERKLKEVFSSAEIVVFVVGRDAGYFVEHEWRWAKSARKRLAVILNEASKLPALLSTIPEPDRHSEGKRCRGCMLFSVAQEVANSLDRKLARQTKSISCGQPPYVVQRHAKASGVAFGENDDFQSRLNDAGCNCGNSCDLAREGLHCAAAVLGSQEQYDRLTRITMALRELANAVKPDCKKLLNPSVEIDWKNWESQMCADIRNAIAPIFALHDLPHRSICFLSRLLGDYLASHQKDNSVVARNLQRQLHDMGCNSSDGDIAQRIQEFNAAFQTIVSSLQGRLRETRASANPGSDGGLKAPPLVNWLKRTAEVHEFNQKRLAGS